jgi:hypothetical protein
LIDEAAGELMPDKPSSASKAAAKLPDTESGDVTDDKHT